MKCGTAEELAKVREFYIELLGLKVIREWAEGMMIDTGNGLLEIFTNADGTHCLGAIRHMALLADDDSMAFCYGPPGEQVEFYMER